MRYRRRSYGNTVVLSDDIGRGNLPKRHPAIHRALINKTLIESAIYCSLIQRNDGSLNEELFKATRYHRKLRALEAIVDVPKPRPRAILEYFVHEFGTDIVAADVRNQMRGRSIDELLERLYQYDRFVMRQTPAVGGVLSIPTRRWVYEEDTWIALWGRDTAFEVVGFRLPVLETSDHRLADALITRVGNHSVVDRQPMRDAYVDIAGSLEVTPAEVASITIQTVNRRTLYAQRERFLADRSFEELLDTIGANIAFMLGEK